MSTVTSYNPARPAEVLGEFPSADAAAVDKAVAAATEAQRSWAKVPVPLRADIVAEAGRLLTERKDELAALVSREAGKVLIEGGGEVQEAIDMAAFVAGQGRGAMGEVVPSELRNKMAFTTRIPVGVVGMITPWNFPMAIPSWKCFPALLAGNGIVIKPSELAPVCGEAFVEVLAESGVPEGLIQVVHGAGDVGAAITTHPGVGAVSFTGSVPTGRKVAAAAMETGPRVVSLELGGKNAMIVLDDADLELATDGALFGAFGTSGQRCTSTSRVLVQKGVAAELVERVAARAAELKLGDPTDPTVDVGPIITRQSAERIAGMLDHAVGEGAVAAGGSGITEVDGCDGGAFFKPTILTGVRPEHRLAREEAFGPLLSVIEVDSDEEAVDIVNQVEYGLSAAVYTQDVNRALRAVDGIDTGICYVNAPTIGAEIPLPFGGTKHTGNGFREAGARGIEQFSQVKTVYVDYSGRLQRAQIDTE